MFDHTVYTRQKTLNHIDNWTSNARATKLVFVPFSISAECRQYNNILNESDVLLFSYLYELNVRNERKANEKEKNCLLRPLFINQEGITHTEP